MRRFLLVLLLIIGCSSTYVNLDVMPSYNAREVNEHWRGIDNLQRVYLMVCATIPQLNISPEDVEKLAPLEDQYLYWSSVARIQTFYQNWPAASEAIAKAKQALQGLASGIKPYINRNSF